MAHRPADGFTPLQKILHWAVVLLLIAQYLVLEDGMGPAFRETVETGTPVLTTYPFAHMVVGIAVLVFALARLGLRAAVGAPLPPAEEPPLAKMTSHIVHFGLYALIVLLPLVGLGAYFIPSPVLGEAHEVGSNLLLAFAGLHVVGVVIHQFWWKTGILGRMT
ncbi:cytochrome b [Acuticoccus kandeliae]|uniref:cytochrome b n=1 Tax=Acuticoccus kandeliae TaxID=2073160 RepID=UPI000D3E8F7E|nr:cytochrome b/b6 domain-containing protein [Acuticoccus kandeliae]